jgi:hypothetical protein
MNVNSAKDVVDAIIATFAITMYFTFVVLLVIGIFMIAPARGQEQYTCEHVRWAVANLSPETIETIKTQMTAKQITAAKKCLRRDARRKVPKSN